jgi:hypothetical protein
VTNNLKNISAVIFALFLFGVSAHACTCVYDDIKAEGSFRGQVFGIRRNEKVPDPQNVLPKATVKVWLPTDEEDTVIAQTVADENGRFVLENIKPGNYVLRVSYPQNGLQDVAVTIKISGGSSLKKKEIVFGLPPLFTCCEGYIKVRKAKKPLKTEPCRLSYPTEARLHLSSDFYL